MLIYNVTTQVNWEIQEPWLQWMQAIHIPEVISTGYFEKYQIARLIEIEESNGPTYVTQFYTLTIEKYQEYLSLHSSILRQRTLDKWGNKLISFRSLMQIVN